MSEPVRHLKVGTVMVREHRGTLHEVMVVPGGFHWQGKIHASLSTIAQDHRNGLERAPLLWLARKGGARRSGPIRDPACWPGRAPLCTRRAAGARPCGGASPMKLMSPKPLRCAIYTRKSTEHNKGGIRWMSAQAVSSYCNALRKNCQSLPLNAMQCSHKALEQNCQHGLINQRRGGADVRCQRELCDQAHAAG